MNTTFLLFGLNIVVHLFVLLTSFVMCKKSLNLSSIWPG